MGAFDEKKAADGQSGSTGLLGVAIALYKPPFRHECGYIFDANNEMVADDDVRDGVARVRGWGRIGYLQNAEELQDRVGDLIAEALNDCWRKYGA